MPDPVGPVAPREEPPHNSNEDGPPEVEEMVRLAARTLSFKNEVRPIQARRGHGALIDKIL